MTAPTAYLVRLPDTPREMPADPNRTAQTRPAAVSAQDHEHGTRQHPADLGIRVAYPEGLSEKGWIFSGFQTEPRQRPGRSWTIRGWERGGELGEPLDRHQVDSTDDVRDGLGG
jgi:hypothetical protein